MSRFERKPCLPRVGGAPPTVTVTAQGLVGFARHVLGLDTVAWESQLHAKVERYLAWGIATFNIVDYQHGVRIYIEDFSVTKIEPRKCRSDRAGAVAVDGCGHRHLHPGDE